MKEPQKSYVPKKGDKDVHFDTITPFVSSITPEVEVETKIPIKKINKNLRSYSNKNLRSYSIDDIEYIQ